MKSTSYVMSELEFLCYQLVVIVICKIMRVRMRFLEYKLLRPASNYPFAPFINRLHVWRRRYNRLIESVRRIDQKLNLLHKEAAF